MKNLTYFVLIMVPLILISSGCPRNRCHIDYKFQIPVSFTPAVDTFHVGDTIHISIEFSDEVLDLNSGNRIKLVDFPFRTAFSIARYDTVPYVTGNFDFDYFPLEGELVQVRHSETVMSNLIKNYDYENNIYSFKVDLIPKRNGLFLYGTNTHKIDTRLFNIDIDEKCKEDYEIVYQTNGESNINFEMLQNSPDPIVETYTIEWFNNGGGYCFYVKE